MAYLDREKDATPPTCAPPWPAGDRARRHLRLGPRFLHSTGQYHKGGPQVGAFLQITGAVAEDLAVPDQPYSFGTLQAAQAAGDRKALADRGRPLLHLHLTDRAAGLGQLLRAGLTGRALRVVVHRPAPHRAGRRAPDLEDGP